MLDFNTSGTTAIMRLGWFRPVLSCGRRVTLYEIQMRSVSGPLKTSVIVYKKEKSLVEEILSKTAEQEFEWMDNKSQQTPQSKSSEPSANPDVSDFVTFRDNVLTNELEIADLKAGGKYQFRVRPQIEGKWLDWELSVLSTTVSVPTCVPDAPFGIRVAPLVADDSATGACVYVCVVVRVSVCTRVCVWYGAVWESGRVRINVHTYHGILAPIAQHFVSLFVWTLFH